MPAFRATQYVTLHIKIGGRKVKTCWSGSTKQFWPSIFAKFVEASRVNWPITKQRPVTEHPCSAAAGPCQNTQKSQGPCLFSPLPNAWLRKLLFWVFHIGDQPSNFSVQYQGVQVGRFVKVLNNFARDQFGDGPWADFHYAKGNMGVTFYIS